MAKKILACDFDGTLRRYDSWHPYIRRDDMEAIASFRAHGNLFGMCSGRALDSILKEMKGMPPADFYIVSSGAVFAEVHPGRKAVIEENEISRDIARAVYEQFGNHKVFYVHLDGRLYRVGKQEEGERAQIYTPRFEDLPEGKIQDVSVGTDSVDTAAAIFKELKKKYGKKLGIYQNNDYLDCVAYGCSKGTGVQKLRERFPGRLIGGIGDSFNDIPLLKAADIAFTFSFSPAKVKECADYIVESAAEAMTILETL